MKIRTKSQLNTVFLAGIALILGLTLVLFYYHKMNEAIEKEKAIDHLNRGVFELNLMTHDYLLNHGTRALTQWQARYDSLGTILSTGFQAPEEKLLLGEIKENYDKLEAIFSKLIINHQSWSNRREMPGYSKQLESRLVGHLMTRLQAMVSVGSQLAQRSDRELMSIQRGASLAVMLSIVILVAMIAVNSILMSKSIVRPIRKLQDDTEIVGKGNLDHPLATAADDELGELSRSFDQMVKNLKTVMASRDELESEIEQRKKAELGLKESEEKYSKLFHANPLWLAFSTLDDGRYLEVNEAFTEIMGYERDEIIGRTSKELGLWPNPEERSKFVKLAQEQGGFRKQEVTFLKKTGEPVSTLWSAETIEMMGTIYLINAITDITELKQAEQALQKSEEKYRTVLESNPDPVVVYDMEGRVIYLNPAFTSVFGWSLEEQIGKKIDDFVPEENWPETRIMIEKVTTLGESFSGLETRRYTKEGNILNISISGSCYRDQEENIAASVINLRDITAQKRLEDQLQQSQKMEAIGTLAGGVAHEFNNVLMGIMGNIELLSMDLAEDEGRNKSFEAMKGSGHRMSRLTDQLLAYAEGGKYQARDMKLDDFVIETLPNLQHDFSPEVRVETHFPKDISYIKADHTQMQMVLSAILANSNEAIEDAGLIRISGENKNIDEVFTKQHPGLKPGPYVCLTIEDDGKGMDEETRSGIFEPFFTTKFQGRGMGMAAVYGIVKSHDGAITVESEPGKGTVVQIYLPAIEAKEEVKEEVDLRPLGELATGEGTILVIEDEEQLVDLFGQILERLGYRVLVAETGKEAVEFAKTFDGQIDLALLDIKLPDMDGGRVYPLIMEARPDLKVIVCSGYSIHGPAQDILDAGAEGFIQKPFLIAALAEKLKEVLEGK